MKMDDSVKSGATLAVSVSFGRFENDALSWEKWSSFSPNKYLEEVGSLSTPGSVAQKKAYFEAHYKKIAAKKAEELEQEKSMSPAGPNPDFSSKDGSIADSSENGTEFCLSNGDRLVEEVAQEACVSNVAISVHARSPKENVEGACTDGFVDTITSEEEIEGSAVVLRSETSVVEESEDVMNANVDNPELNARKDQVLVGLETQPKNTQSILEKRWERKNGRKQASVPNKELSKSNARNIASKVTPMKKEKNLSGAKKKVVPPAAKPLQASTPKYAKPTAISTPVTASEALKKKLNGSAPRSKNYQLGEINRTAPKSLHMSLSLGPADSLGSLSMTRKSLIMERMGDKDIVKRAFKTFQNRANGSISDKKPSPVRNVPSTAFVPKMSSYHTPTEGNEGLRRDAEKRANQRSQTGTRSNPLPSGSHKSLSHDKKSTIVGSPATGLKSDEKAEKRKEFLKKLGVKSIARGAENAQLGAKLKVGVENGVRQRPTLNR